MISDYTCPNCCEPSGLDCEAWEASFESPDPLLQCKSCGAFLMAMGDEMYDGVEAAYVVRLVLQ
jgi:hypothetical protein